MMNSTFLLGVDVLVFVVINIWLGQAIKQAETRINIDTK